jgi:hypothetical protein
MNIARGLQNPDASRALEDRPPSRDNALVANQEKGVSS